MRPAVGKHMNIPEIKALIFMKEHSERVPGKNVRPMCGRPLFHWIMDSLIRSQYIQEVIVNTDSISIAENARRNFGAIIHMRPDYLLGDRVGASPLIAYDVAHTKGEYFFQTHSTNPLLRIETIDRAIEAFFGQNEHDSLFSVTSVQKRFYWPDGTPVNHDPSRLIRTQDLPVIYEENSCFYIFTRSSFELSRNRIGERPMLFPIDSMEAWDIDEELDFAVAETLMAKRIAAIACVR